jgi:hypothetical protein
MDVRACPRCHTPTIAPGIAATRITRWMDLVSATALPAATMLREPKPGPPASAAVPAGWAAAALQPASSPAASAAIA